MLSQTSLVFLLLSCILSIETVSAQVWPKGFAQQPGGKALISPFTEAKGLPGTRGVILMEAPSLPIASGALISGISFRRDSVYKWTYGQFLPRVRITIGNVADAMHQGSPLRSLWLANSQQVLDANIQIPVAGFPGTKSVAGFNLRLPFDTPWRYQGGDLGVDIITVGKGAWRVDAARLGANSDAQVEQLGLGGPVLTNRMLPYSWVDVARAHPGGMLESKVRGAPAVAGGAAFWLLGLDPAIVANYPAAIPLDPIGFPVGAVLRVAFYEGEAVPTQSFTRFDAQATTGISLPVPNVPSLAGSKLALQWLVHDPLLNEKFPFAASNAYTIALGSTAQGSNVGRYIWGNGSTEFNGGFPAQILEPNYVPIIKFW